jgi:hypothetical protein
MMQSAKKELSRCYKRVIANKNNDYVKSTQQQTKLQLLGQKQTKARIYPQHTLAEIQ